MIRHLTAVRATVALLGALASANVAAISPVLDSSGSMKVAPLLNPVRDMIASIGTAQSDGTKVTPELKTVRSHALLWS